MKRKLLYVFGIICTCIFMLSGCANQSASQTSKGSTTPLSTTTPSVNSNAFPNTNIGDIINFGSYNNEAISWRVLDKQYGKMLLISDKALFQKGYNDEKIYITWEDCTLRAYLNGEFYDSCFNSAEQMKIATTHVINSKNPNYGTSGGSDTDDKIFLLSIDEANQYFSSADALKAMDLKGDTIEWWLRSPGYETNCAAIVNINGEIDDYRYYVYYDKGGVRPALWVNLGS